MKLKVLVPFLLLSGPAFGAEVLSAKLDPAKQNILIDVSYGGGCKEHVFELDMSRGCAESMPVQCSAQLVDKTTDDFCEAIIHKTIKISLKKAGLNDPYFDRASLTIAGSRGSATVRLPALGEATAPRETAKKVACVTNTGAALEINPSERQAVLESTTGEVTTFQIQNINLMSLESNPPIEQTTYQLNDGRSIVIEFTGDRKLGSGYYIRVGGTASPRFQSCQKIR